MSKKNNQKILFIGVGVFVAVIVGVGSVIFSSMSSTKQANTGTGSTVTAKLSVNVIGDKRCSSCMTDQLVSQIQQAPFLKDATFTVQDFADSGVSQYLKDNKIATLPAFVFSTKDIPGGGDIAQYLSVLPDGKYTLALGSTFDPFAKRSDKGFLIVDANTLSLIKKESHIKGNPKAKISWIEYSDIECPYCAKLHNSGTIEKIEAQYGESLNRVFQNFPLPMHKNAFPGAQILECAGKIGGSNLFFDLAKNVYKQEKSDRAFMLGEATKLGLDSKEIEVCLDADTYKDKITKQIEVGQKVFAISATPANVIVNNETGEYELVSGNMPVEVFTGVIDRLLK